MNRLILVVSDVVITQNHVRVRMMKVQRVFALVLVCRQQRHIELLAPCAGNGSGIFVTRHPTHAHLITQMMQVPNIRDKIDVSKPVVSDLFVLYTCYPDDLPSGFHFLIVHMSA